MNTVDTVIVGAGQAGLALSRLLTDAGQEHVVLERGRIAERWRSERWDSFRLLTPNWMSRLPGYQYAGRDHNGFMDKDEVTRFFASYAASFDAPVLTGTTVFRVTPTAGRWRVETSSGDWLAGNVVIATGHYDQPRQPDIAAGLSDGVHQMFARDYRNSAHVPSGGVIIVGAGPSGQQIADELAVAGRSVSIAAGRHRPLPRRYRGHDVYWWLDRMGALARRADSLPDPSAAANASSAVLAGGRHDLDLHRLVRHGVRPLGRLVEADGTSLRFADDLGTTVALADAHRGRFKAEADSFAYWNGISAQPADDSPMRPAPSWAEAAPTAVDVRGEGIGTVIWATGYRRDFSWLDAAILDPAGEPVQRRGVTPAPGLFFLGLRFMHRRNSNFIDGVGADAAYLARFIQARYVRQPAVA